MRSTPQRPPSFRDSERQLAVWNAEGGGARRRRAGIAGRGSFAETVGDYWNSGRNAFFISAFGRNRMDRFPPSFWPARKRPLKKEVPEHLIRLRFGYVC